MGIKCSAAEAAARVNDGDTILLSGFYGFGSAPDLIRELLKQGKKDLTVVANEGGLHGQGAGP